MFAVLLLLVALVGGSWLLAVVAHVDDGHAVDHVAGTWIALARYANEGTLYPPLFDGKHFGGTRFGPIPIVIQAIAARITGEYLVSAKILSAALALGLAAMTFGLLRRKCPLPVALGLSSTLLVTGTGLVAATSIRNDVLPVLLQLGAVGLVGSRRSRTSVVVAGLLCGVAVLCKLSAVWAPVAIVVWLAQRERRRLPQYAAAFIGAVVVGFVVFQFVSHGRLTDNLVELSATSSDRFGSFDDVLERIRLIVREGLGALVLLPLLAMVGTLAAARRRNVGIYHLAFVAALLVTFAVLLDPGAYVNHLLDMQVLSLLVIGDLWRQVTPVPPSRPSWASFTIVVGLVAATSVTYVQNVSAGSDLRVLIEGTDAADRVPRLEETIGNSDRVLSEDPFIPVSRDLHPVILDPFMLISLFDRHPEWERDLIGRITRAEFDKIVLLYVPEEAPEWYRRVHLGSEVVHAIERRYRPAEQVDDYWVYVPR
jgi:hypothetical protein